MRDLRHCPLAINSLGNTHGKIIAISIIDGETEAQGLGQGTPVSQLQSEGQKPGVLLPALGFFPRYVPLPLCSAPHPLKFRAGALQPPSPLPTLFRQHSRVDVWCAAEELAAAGNLGSSPHSAIKMLCDLGKAQQPLWFQLPLCSARRLELVPLKGLWQGLFLRVSQCGFSGEVWVEPGLGKDGYSLRVIFQGTLETCPPLHLLSPSLSSPCLWRLFRAAPQVSACGIVGDLEGRWVAPLLVGPPVSPGLSLVWDKLGK